MSRMKLTRKIPDWTQKINPEWRCIRFNQLFDDRLLITFQHQSGKRKSLYLALNAYTFEQIKKAVQQWQTTDT